MCVHLLCVVARNHTLTQLCLRSTTLKSMQINRKAGDWTAAIYKYLNGWSVNLASKFGVGYDIRGSYP